MAKQTVNIGTIPNDGTGDALRMAFDKLNDNDTELYSVHGWGYYQDGETTPQTQTFNTTPAKISIDGLGANTETGYLPYEIRGSGELWDTTNDEITPIGVGDSYTMRLDFTVNSETGSPNNIFFQLDIGGGASPTNSIVEHFVKAGKATPYKVSIEFSIFTLGTFTTNGGQIFISTDSGSITVGPRDIFLSRISSGQI
jgi:hypothetical protein